MVNRKRFCVVCGLEETPTVKLSDGLCPKCLADEKPEATVYTIPTIRLCKLCGSLEEKGKWLPPSSNGLEEDLSALLKRIPKKFTEIGEGDVSSISIRRIPTPIGSNGVLIPISIKIRASSHQNTHLLKELDAKVRLTPTICPNCSLMKRKYYEATLQIRTSCRKMSLDEKEKLLGRINSLVEKSSEKHKQAFISKYEDKIGGFDLYLGSRQAAYSIASKFRAMRGTTTKEAFKVGKVDKSTGKRSGKVTILIRLPEQETYDSADVNKDSIDYAKN